MRHIYRDPEGLWCTANLWRAHNNDLYEGSPPGWLLTSIQTKIGDREKWAASRTLREILNDADQEKVTLFLSISPDESGGLEYETLRSWYERNGFQLSVLPYLFVRCPNANSEQS
jgi:hypothetical protein